MMGKGAELVVTTDVNYWGVRGKNRLVVCRTAVLNVGGDVSIKHEVLFKIQT